MATTRDYTDFLNDQVDIAPANSQEELDAAELIESLFAQHGLETQLQEFETPTLSGLSTGVYFILLFVGVLLSGFLGTVVSAVGLVLVVAAFALLVLARQGTDLLASVGPQARSQNVIGVHRATGPNVIKGNRPIVIVAHYDTPRENFLYGGQLARWQPLIKRLSWPFAIVTAILALLQLPPFIPAPVRHVFWILGVLVALPLLLQGAASLYERFASCTTGASDNKASMAALLGVLDMVRPGPDDAKAWAQDNPKGVRRSLDEDETFEGEDFWDEDEEPEGAYDDEYAGDEYAGDDYAGDDYAGDEDAYPAEDDLEARQDDEWDTATAGEGDQLADDDLAQDDGESAGFAPLASARSLLGRLTHRGEDEEPPAEDTEDADYAEDDVAFFDEDGFELPAGARRGADLLASLQILPEDCEIAYVDLTPRDELLARRAAAAELSGSDDEDTEEELVGSGGLREAAGGLGEKLGGGFATLGETLRTFVGRIRDFFVKLFARLRGEDAVLDEDGLELEIVDPGDEGLGDEDVAPIDYDLDESFDMTRVGRLDEADDEVPLESALADHVDEDSLPLEAVAATEALAAAEPEPTVLGIVEPEPVSPEPALADPVTTDQFEEGATGEIRLPHRPVVHDSFGFTAEVTPVEPPITVPEVPVTIEPVAEAALDNAVVAETVVPEQAAPVEDATPTDIYDVPVVSPADELDVALPEEEAFTPSAVADYESIEDDEPVQLWRPAADLPQEDELWDGGAVAEDDADQPTVDVEPVVETRLLVEEADDELPLNDELPAYEPADEPVAEAAFEILEEDEGYVTDGVPVEVVDVPSLVTGIDETGVLFKAINASHKTPVDAADEQPATEDVADEQPAIEDVADEQPATEDAADEQPATEDVADEQPTAEEARDEEPVLAADAEEAPVEAVVAETVAEVVDSDAEAEALDEGVSAESVADEVEDEAALPEDVVDEPAVEEAAAEDELPADVTAVEELGDLAALDGAQPQEPAVAEEVAQPEPAEGAAAPVPANDFDAEVGVSEEFRLEKLSDEEAAIESLWSSSDDESAAEAEDAGEDVAVTPADDGESQAAAVIDDASTMDDLDEPDDVVEAEAPATAVVGEPAASEGGVLEELVPEVVTFQVPAVEEEPAAPAVAAVEEEAAAPVASAVDEEPAAPAVAAVDEEPLAEPTSAPTNDDYAIEGNDDPTLAFEPIPEQRIETEASQPATYAVEDRAASEPDPASVLHRMFMTAPERLPMEPPAPQSKPVDVLHEMFSSRPTIAPEQPVAAARPVVDETPVSAAPAPAMSDEVMDAEFEVLEDAAPAVVEPVVDESSAPADAGIESVLSEADEAIEPAEEPVVDSAAVQEPVVAESVAPEEPTVLEGLVDATAQPESAPAEELPAVTPKVADDEPSFDDVASVPGTAPASAEELPVDVEPIAEAEPPLVEAIAADAPAEEAPAAAPVDPDATVFAPVLAEGITFSAEEDVSDEELADKDVTGLTTMSADAQADVEDTMDPVDESVPRPRAVDDPDWGTTSFKPSGMSVGRRAMLLDLPDPSVMAVDPLVSSDREEAAAQESRSQEEVARRFEVLSRVPSPADDPRHDDQRRARMSSLPSIDALSSEREPEERPATAEATPAIESSAADAPDQQPQPYNRGKGKVGSRSHKKDPKRKVRFGQRRRKRDDEPEEQSLSEMLGLDDDYDAKKDGRQIGNWDNFDDDKRGGGGWKGGATLRAGLRGDDDIDEVEDDVLEASTAAVPNFDALDLRGAPDADTTAASAALAQDDPVDQIREPDAEELTELREAVLHLGDDDLIAHDIWFVGTGAASLDHAGIKAFLDEHRRDIRGAFLVNLDSIGAGDLTLLTGEGTGKKRRADRRMVRMLSSIADALHIELGRTDYSWDTTDATTAMQSRVRVATLMGLSADGVPAHSHTAQDEPEYLNDQQIADVADIIAELIRRS